MGDYTAINKCHRLRFLAMGGSMNREPQKPQSKLQESPTRDLQLRFKKPPMYLRMIWVSDHKPFKALGWRLSRLGNATLRGPGLCHWSCEHTL